MLSVRPYPLRSSSSKDVRVRNYLPKCSRVGNVHYRQGALSQRTIAWWEGEGWPVRESRIMPIRMYLDGQQFDVETIRVMGVAFEMAKAALGLEDSGDAAVTGLAHTVIAL